MSPFNCDSEASRAPLTRRQARRRGRRRFAHRGDLVARRCDPFVVGDRLALRRRDHDHLVVDLVARFADPMGQRRVGFVDLRR